MTIILRRLSLLCLILGLLALFAGFALAQDDDTDTAEPAATEDVESEMMEDAESDATPEPVAADRPGVDTLSLLDQQYELAYEPTGDNGYCTICHNVPLRTQRLLDGSLLNLYVNPAMITASVHGPTEDRPGLGCLDCHGEDSFPHSGPPPANQRVYTLDRVSMCTECHVDQGEDLQMGLHAQAISEGNLEAAVCTDCHGAHHIQTVENEPQLVAGVCGDCHETTLEEWQISAHAEIGPLGCASCHNHHAQTLRAGETSTELCLTCHAEMDPIYPHETHLTSDNPVACVDCHMFAIQDEFAVEDTDGPGQLISLDMDSTGHTMLLDSTPCTTCHNALEESGEWAQIVSERAGVAVEDGDANEETIVDAMEEDEAPIEEANAAGDSTMFVLQGLLVGLGLGATFAIVFVTRSLRGRND